MKLETIKVNEIEKLDLDQLAINQSRYNFVSSVNYLETGPIDLWGFLDEDSYQELNLSERIVMCMLSRMYNLHPSHLTDYRLRYLDKCNTWKKIKTAAQLKYLGHTEDIDVKEVLKGIIAKYVSLYLPEIDKRRELMYALRLWHLLRYDKNEVIDVIEKDSHFPLAIHKELIFHLSSMKVWKFPVLAELLYELTRNEYYIQYPNIESRITLKISHHV